MNLAPAKWIWLPSQRCLPNTFVLFRRELDLAAAPRVATGWILADSRYKLTVNGRRVQWGPAPADPRWQVDCAPHRFDRTRTYPFGFDKQGHWFRFSLSTLAFMLALAGWGIVGTPAAMGGSPPGKDTQMISKLEPTAEPLQSNAFHPGKAWLDDRGKPIESHLGGLYYENGVYYWYGMSFDGETVKPFTYPQQKFSWMINPGTTCYSSKDLLRWKLESLSLAAVKDDPAHPLCPPNWVIRPKVLKCAKTGKYIMMAQLVSADFSTLNKVVVGIADTPRGPFTYQKVLDPPGGGYDITLYQDDDGKAYLICAHEWVKAHLLSEDFLAIQKTYELKGVTGEAPAVFKHEGVYYFLTSHLTGWGPNPNKYAVAATFLGPYETKGTFCVGTGADNSFGGQTTFVLPAPGHPGKFIWMADRVNAKSQTEIDDLRQATHIWLPITLDSAEKRLRVEWRDQWDLRVFTDGLRVETDRPGTLRF